MAEQVPEAIESLGQREETIASNGFSYNIVFNVSNLTNSLIKSPTYTCGNDKIQIHINFEKNPISISIDLNGSINNFNNAIFDFYISNQDQSKSIHFNENSPIPFNVNLNFDDINANNGWIHNDSLRTVLVFKDRHNEITISNQKINYKTIQNLISPLITRKKEVVEWSIPELSEWHSSDLYDIKFANVILILSLEENYYSFQMSFENIQKNKCFLRAKFILHNKDPAKNITKNIYELVTSSFPETKSLVISEINPADLTVENGWIIENSLKITVEFATPQKNIPNLPASKISNNQKYINFHRLPPIDYLQSMPLKGIYFIDFNPSIDDILNQIYKTKIRVGQFIVTFSLDVDKKMASLEFENLDENVNFFTIIDVTFLNIDHFNMFETSLTQNVSKENSSISFDSPFDRETIKEGWLFEADENIRKEHLIIEIGFNLDTKIECFSPYEPIEIKQSFNDKYYVSIEIPQSQFNSDLVLLPQFLFDDRKMNVFVCNNDIITLYGYLDGCPQIVMDGEMTIVNVKNSASNLTCKFDSFKGFSFKSAIPEISFKDVIKSDAGYINSETNCLLFQFSFVAVPDDHVFMPIEPQFEKYVSYENESNQDDKSDKDFAIERPIQAKKYVGLINQGATCYMNSMLQALFHLPAFRRIVYNMPTTGNEDPEKSITLNLQRLFCEMQFSPNREPCSTEGLTKSFGWGSKETFVQHDVEEFCRVLMDNLQMKMKGDPSLENSINQLFGVKARHAIRCVNVNYESIREEPLLDIQINVKNCRNLEDSFKQYLEKEVMDGDNQYSTDKYGKQDAVIGDEFLEFPPVLHLHLKRFIFDFNTMKMTKLNDYYEFPEQIDLSKFLAKDAPGLSKSNLYDLYGVLVHAGGILGGHYDAYLRTSTDKQWYNFNDSHVTPVSTYKAVRANYGYSKSDEKASASAFDFLGKREEIEESESILKSKKKSKDEKEEDFSHFDSSKNGYMLIYVRHDDAPMLFAPIPEESVPKHLTEYVKEHVESKKLYLSNTSYERGDKSFTFSLTHEDDLKHITVDQSSVISMKNNIYRKDFTVKDSIQYSQIYKIAAETYKVKVDEIRIWSCTTCYAPSNVIQNNDKDTLSSAKIYTRNFYFFVQKKKADEKLEVPANHVIMFLKFFFPGKEAPLQYLKSVIIENSDIMTIFSNCCEIVIEQLGLPKDIKLTAYIENLYGLPRDLESYAKQAHHFINNGSVLIFAPDQESQITPSNFEFTYPSNQEVHEEEKNETSEKEKDDIPVYKFNEYFDDMNTNTVIGYISSKESIEFEVYDLNKQMKPLFKIITPKKVRSVLVKEKIIEFAKINFNFDEDSLLLFSLTCDYYQNPTIQLIDTKFQHASFENVFKQDKSILHIDCDHLYFLHCKNFNYDNSSRLITFPNINFSYDAKSADFLVCLPRTKETNLHNFIELFKKITEGVDIGNGPFRLLKIYQSKITDVFNDASEDSKKKITFDATSKFRFEIIPESQRQEQLIASNAFLVSTCYARETTYSIDAFGNPFMFEVRKDELFVDTLVRLRKYMDVPDTDDLQSYKFLLKNDESFFSKKYTEMLDQMKMYDKCNPKSQFLILTVDNEKKSKSVIKQKSNDIKIYN